MVKETPKDPLDVYIKSLWDKNAEALRGDYTPGRMRLWDVLRIPQRGTCVIITSPLPVVETGPYSIKTLDGAGNLVYVGAGKDGYHSLKETYRAVYAYATESSAA